MEKIDDLVGEKSDSEPWGVETYGDEYRDAA
jgi:hypothetical protein